MGVENPNKTRSIDRNYTEVRLVHIFYLLLRRILVVVSRMMTDSSRENKTKPENAMLANSLYEKFSTDVAPFCFLTVVATLASASGPEVYRDLEETFHTSGTKLQHVGIFSMRTIESMYRSQSTSVIW